MKYLKKYFTIWWIPIICYLLPIFIFYLGTVLKSNDIIDYALMVFYLNVLGNVISSIVQIAIKKWYFIFPQFIITLFLFVYMLIIFMFNPPDYYGENKTIPVNVKFESEIERELNEQDLNLNDFKITSIKQPGIYEYYVHFKPTEKGYIYIKVYEITSNDRLSEYDIFESSKTIIDDLEINFYTNEFTIYEGSWGDKYGARIELWFKPNDGTEYQLNQKNYVVEGWMR